ncbi:putative YhdH/YhfP family quinone oxidoreductase [Pullulanibacillus pueri]|uniref:Putative quinone oxidoreductase YhfP n=1 Tax=Pullulanibacillus pueri TaxID=1437324 RepID=A0A8J2ZSF4_9BACL|nr:acryloyl-CoA reductase [Pullulanibacillus pueri]MBM7680304.1 putative YhdH/YhfP family quinone oxidoreductase [Pullulanibacillus pueri]GGH75743.1 putative quinone oxidoreductase YhfP [Pullulanibacillus pueri]
MQHFKAFVLDKRNDQLIREVKELTFDDLPEGEVTVKVAYSSVNYKDGFVIMKGAMATQFPLIPGIDLAGTVIESRDGRFKEGDPVIVTSYELGTGHHGGYSEVARVPAKWVVPLPKGLTLRESMILGTAGFTAALSIQRLEENGLNPEKGPVLVAGATGGVGSIAVDSLAKKGYEVVASTGKSDQEHYLKNLGAKNIIHREDLLDKEGQIFREERWAGAIDPVGGQTLQYILSTLKYGGSVATSGMAGGGEVATTVFPFISRAINWLGIDSVHCPMDIRQKVWQRLAGDLKPEHLNEEIVNEIPLDNISNVSNRILQGQVKGRTLVKL